METATDFLAPSVTMIVLKDSAGEEELKHCSDFLNKAGLNCRVITACLPMAGHQRLLLELHFNQDYAL